MKPEDIYILLGCEESQAVTIELRKLGYQAFSCDLLPCSGGHPEWHIQRSLLEVFHERKWHALICFPPCTHIASSGAAWFEKKIADGRQQEGINFFMQMVNAPFDIIAIENPIGIMSRLYREPDQIIHPYYFGDSYSKSTCLWLKNLPLLYHNKSPNLFDEVVTHVDRGEFVSWVDKKGRTKKMAKWYNDARSGQHGHKRSKTFKGIAYAMASQWSEHILNYYEKYI
jgi:hypothetical protein